MRSVVWETSWKHDDVMVGGRWLLRISGDGGEGDVVRSPPCDDVMPSPHMNWDTAAWSTLVTPMIPGTGDLLLVPQKFPSEGS